MRFLYITFGAAALGSMDSSIESSFTELEDSTADSMDKSLSSMSLSKSLDSISLPDPLALSATSDLTLEELSVAALAKEARRKQSESLSMSRPLVDISVVNNDLSAPCICSDCECPSVTTVVTTVPTTLLTTTPIPTTTATTTTTVLPTEIATTIKPTEVATTVIPAEAAKTAAPAEIDTTATPAVSVTAMPPVPTAVPRRRPMPCTCPRKICFEESCRLQRRCECEKPVCRRNCYQKTRTDMSKTPTAIPEISDQARSTVKDQNRKTREPVKDITDMSKVSDETKADSVKKTIPRASNETKTESVKKTIPGASNETRADPVQETSTGVSDHIKPDLSKPNPNIVKTSTMASKTLYEMDANFVFSAKIKGERVRIRYNTCSSKTVWTRPETVVRVGGGRVKFTRGKMNVMGGNKRSGLVQALGSVGLVPTGNGKVLLIPNPAIDTLVLKCRSKKFHSVRIARGSISIETSPIASTFAFVSGSSTIGLPSSVWSQFSNRIRAIPKGSCKQYPMLKIRIGNLQVNLHGRDYVRRTKNGKCQLMIVESKNQIVKLGAPFMRKVISIWKRDGSISMCLHTNTPASINSKMTPNYQPSNSISRKQTLTSLSKRPINTRQSSSRRDFGSNNKDPFALLMKNYSKLFCLFIY